MPSGLLRNPTCVTTSLEVVLERHSTSVLSQAELQAIAEIDATTDILKLVVRLTGMRFAAIAKFADDDWFACSVNDEISLGIKAGDRFPLEHSMCGNLVADQRNLVVPCISAHATYRDNVSSQRYGFDSCISVPIFLRDGQLFGAICVLDPQSRDKGDEQVVDTLVIFARLVGNILSWHGATAALPG